MDDIDGYDDGDDNYGDEDENARQANLCGFDFIAVGFENSHQNWLAVRIVTEQNLSFVQNCRVLHSN